MLKLVKNVIRNFRIMLNRIGCKKRNSLLKHKDVTIISNNCYAGLTYEYLNLPFNSPTIGLYFFAEEYIKFIKKIKYYTTLPLEEMNVKDSKYYDELKKLKQDDKVIGKLDDVEIVFLHYKNFKEAKEKWERRCKRINYSKLIVKFNDQNLCSEKEINEFSALKYKNKICFTAKDYGFESDICLKKYSKCDFVREDIYNSRKYFNIIDYINNMKVEK